jgi:hypothetical protein
MTKARPPAKQTPINAPQSNLSGKYEREVREQNQIRNRVPERRPVKL